MALSALDKKKALLLIEKCRLKTIMSCSKLEQHLKDAIDILKLDEEGGRGNPMDSEVNNSIKAHYRKIRRKCEEECGSYSGLPSLQEVVAQASDPISLNEYLDYMLAKYKDNHLVAFSIKKDPLKEFILFLRLYTYLDLAKKDLIIEMAKKCDNTYSQVMEELVKQAEALNDLEIFLTAHFKGKLSVKYYLGMVKSGCTTIVITGANANTSNADKAELFFWLVQSYADNSGILNGLDDLKAEVASMEVE